MSPVKDDNLSLEIANMASSCNKNNKIRNLKNKKKHGSLMKANTLGVWYENAAKLEKKLLLDVVGDGNNKVYNVEEWKCLVDKKKEYANRLLSQYIHAYAQKLHGDIKMVMATQGAGTANDKVSASLVLLGDNPIANINSIDILLGMVTSKVGKRYAFTAFEALKQIFISSLLPDRKLKTLFQQPLNKIPDSKDGNSLLLLWHYEECLKRKYGCYISALEEASKDSLDSLKDKAMKTVYVLLRSKSEQERKLLSVLVNKLGDPANKAASNASYLLLKLLCDHPNMNAVVVDNVDSYLFRPHLASRATYHGVTFLNQINLSRHGEGGKVAERLLDIYFALFKMLISDAGGLYKQKTSKDDAFKKTFTSSNDRDTKRDADFHVEMDSRLLSALLTGVNRAFRYVSSNEADDVIEPQIPMLFQLVHSKNFNVGLQALMLLEQISTKNQVVSDRFYRALYSKLLLPSAMNTSKEKMFIGLLSRVMKNDLNLRRVSAFAKRLLQVSLQQPPQYACACLLLLSEVLKSKPLLWNMVVQNELVDEDLEHFEDMVEEPHIQAIKTADIPPDSDGGDYSENENDDHSEDEAPHGSDDDFSDKSDDDLLGFGGLANLQESQRPFSQLRVQNAESFVPGGYNLQHREPIYCNADRVGWWELTVLASHVHPSVSTMAKTLLRGANIVYNGNPLKDLSLGSFLDKFLEKKPKARNWHGGSKIEPAKQLDMDKPLIGPDILQLDEMEVAPEDVVFHKFYLNKKNSSKKPKKKKKKGPEEEAAEDLIGEGGNDESDNEEIDAILDSISPALDFEDDYDHEDLDQLADEDDDLGGDDTSDEELIIGDSEDGSEVKPGKRKAREKTGVSPFASLEDYEHLLNDNIEDYEHLMNDNTDENIKVNDPKKRKKYKIV